MDNLVGYVNSKSNRTYINIFINGLIISWFIYTISSNSYMLFHFSAETFAAIISFCIFIIALNARSFTGDNYLILLGIAFGFVGICNIIHILSGTQISIGITQNISYQIRVVQRIIEGITFFLFAALLQRKPKLNTIFSSYLVMAAILLLSIFNWCTFPECYNGSGFTAFYLMSGWIMAGILLVSFLLLLRNRKKLSNRVFYFMSAAYLILLISEILLTDAPDYSYMDMLRHFLKIVSFYLIYKAIVESSLMTPYRLMFYELKSSNDALKAKTIEMENEIVQRKKAEEELSHSRNFYLALSENLPEIVWMMGTDMKCSYVNKWCSEYTGMPLEMLLGDGLMGSIHKDDFDVFYSAAAEAFNVHRSFEVELRIRRYDGEYRWHSVSGRPVDDANGCFDGYIGVCYDITEKKQKEEAEKLLLESQSKYRSLFENMNEAFVFGQVLENAEGEKETKILEVNPAFERMIGVKPENIVGEDIFQIFADMPLTYNKVDFDCNCERYEIKADLLKKWFSVSTYRMDKGYFADFISDITGQKLLHERLEKSNKDLLSILEELKQTQAQLIQQEKLAGIGQLAAGIAHEINNPLGFIMSNCETLKRYLAKIKELTDSYVDLKNSLAAIEYDGIRSRLREIDEIEERTKIDFVFSDLKDLIDDTDGGLKRIHNIVKELRTFSRVDQQNRMEQYDLNAGIRSTLIVAQNEIKYAAKIESCLRDIPTIYADGGQINQVLLNIIINAVHAIKAKQSMKIGKVKITTSSDSNFVSCVIEDNGIGIPEKNMVRIFEPFFTTKPVGQGTGLGLSISYDIVVNKHGGELLIDSSEGQGTRVTIKIPLVRKCVS